MIDPQSIEAAIEALERSDATNLSESVLQTIFLALRHQQQLAEQAEIGMADMRGERKQVTVMFADISGFTAMSEKLDPEEVRTMINLVFDRLGDVVEKYEGHIDKFIGDEIMALFGAPIAHENDPERAVRAALEMMQALKLFNAEFGDRIPKPLSLHFGINTGLVIAGGIGTSKRQDYSVMGDTVNLAARLEDLSESGEILVGETTYRLTAPLFEFEALEPVKLKGKAKPVQVYRVLRAKTIRGGQIRGIEGIFSPMVGREPAFDQLKTVYQNLSQGQGGAVSIVAEAGLGKSRLVVELRKLSEIDDIQVQWASGRALSHAQNASYLIVKQVINSLLGIEDEAPIAEIGHALKTETNLLFPDHPDEIYPYLARLLDVPLDEQAAQRIKYLDGELLRQRIWQASTSYIAVKSDQTPLILVWDDLHWADPSSLAVLETLLPLTKACRILNILMYRPRQESLVWEFCQSIESLMGDHHIRLELSALPRQDSDLLLKNLLGACTIPSQIHQRILEKSEGNPFYVEEVIRSLLNSGALILGKTAEDCVVTAEPDAIAIPDTLQGVIMSRIDQLASDVKRTLQVAAVMGRTFSADILGEVFDESESLTSHLLYLEQQDVIKRRAEGTELLYAFNHVFTQESVYQSLLRSDRTRLHQEVGEAIEVVRQGHLSDQASLLAYHFEQSPQREKAVEYLTMAAENAVQAYANQEAKIFFTRAVALVDRSKYAQRWDLLMQREQVVDRLGDRDQQATDLTVMQTLAELMEDERRLAQTHNRRAAYFDKISEYQAADEAAGAGLRVAQRISDARLEAQSLNALALAAWRRFDYRKVQKWASQALDALKIIGDPATRIAALLHLGKASYRLGQYDTALKYIMAAQDVANETDNRDSDALADLILGWIYQRLGVFEQSEVHYRLMLTKRGEIGDRYGEATAVSHLGWLAADQQQYEQGLELCQQAIEMSQAIADRENESYALSGLALNYELLGNLDEAIPLYDTALEIHQQIGATTLAIFDQAGLARIALAQKDFDKAREHATSISDWILAGKAQQFWDPWIIYRSACDVLSALGEMETAHTIVTEAYTILQERAKEISDETLRNHFLNVETNQAISAAWRRTTAADVV